MKRVFLSFADSRMRPSANRIKKQAMALGVYDRIIVANESCLDVNFREKFKTQLVFGTIGYGYWVWKPQIILQTLREMDDGEILQYSDVGCHLNKNGKRRLLEYYNLAENSKTGILAFQAKPPSSPLPYDGRRLPDLPDFRWIKGDLLDYFRVRQNNDLLKEQTIGAGVIFIKKCNNALRLIEDWVSVANFDFALIDSSPSRSQNLSGFIEHRHDQAIFSILCKLNKVETLSSYEYWYPSIDDSMKPDWTILDDFPIHARRDKVLRIRTKLVRKCKTVVRGVIAFLSNRL
jgi:hypothetical protein